MFNSLVWLITVACFAVALRATYLMAFERALRAPGGKRDEPDAVAVPTPEVTVEPAAAPDEAPAGAELDEARQRNRDLVREVASLKEQLYASQSAARKLQDRLDATARREAESSDEQKTQSAWSELAALRRAYQNGDSHADVNEQRQEALRQIDEIEGEMAGLLSRQVLPGSAGAQEAHDHEAGADDRLAGVERELATLVQTNKEINDENARLREEFAFLERRLQQQASDSQAALESQQSLAEIVAKLQSLTNETIALQRSLKVSAAEPSADRAESSASAVIDAER